MKIVIQQTEIPLEKMIYENFREANKLYAEDKYDEAIKKCDDILLKEKISNKTPFFLIKGFCLHNQKKFNESIAALQEALSGNLSVKLRYSALMIKFKSHAELSQEVELIQCIDEFLENHAEQLDHDEVDIDIHARLLYIRGNAYGKKYKYDQAIQYLRSAMKKCKTDTLLNSIKSLMEKIENVLNKARDIGNQNFASINANFQETPIELELLERATNNYCDKLEAYEKLLSIYSKNNQLDKLAAISKKMISRFPQANLGMPYYYLCSWQIKSQKKLAAIKNAKRCLQYETPEAVIMTMIKFLFKEVIESYDHFTCPDPSLFVKKASLNEHAEAWINFFLAELYSRHYQPELARTFLETAESKNPNEPLQAKIKVLRKEIDAYSLPNFLENSQTFWNSVKTKEKDMKADEKIYECFYQSSSELNF